MTVTPATRTLRPHNGHADLQPIKGDGAVDLEGIAGWFD